MFDNPDLFPYLVAGAMSAMITLLIILVVFAVRRGKETNSQEDLLQDLMSDGNVNQDAKVTLMRRWNGYWGNIFKTAGVARYNDDDNRAGREVLLLAGAAAILVTLLTRNPIVAVVVTVVLVWGTSMVLKMRANKKTEEISVQLPGFLFALKANIQASDTNERAVLKVVDSMPSPLYEDLLIVKNRLLANGTFREALEEMSEKTASRDLKFLCACMIQASSSGANMLNQIDSIQKVLDARRKVSNEIARAVKTVQPAIMISTFVIPALFLASYFMDASSRSFWFVEPMSWVALGATAALYIIGMVLSKIQIDKIKNM